jgi:hypothetical protein
MEVKRINQRIGKKKHNQFQKKKGGVKGYKVKNYKVYLCIGSSPMIQ